MGATTCVNGIEGCSQVTQPTTETCNDKDDDWDGEVDNYSPPTTTVDWDEIPNCNAGNFTITVAQVCDDGDLKPVLNAGDDFCVICDTDPNGCGLCNAGTTDCLEDNDCPAGYICNEGTGDCEDDPDCAIVGCWKPSQKGTCPSGFEI